MAIRDPQHGEQVKSRLLSAAAELFVRVGYEATTVRDIAASAQVTTGSLYHFFENKEGLLDHLVRDVFIATEKMADEATKASRDPFLCASYELCMQLELISADRRLAAVYSAAYASPAISRNIIELAVLRLRKLVTDQAPEAPSEALAYRLAIATKSLMTGLIQEKMSLDRLSSAERRRILLAGMWAQLPVGVDVERLMRALDKLLAENQETIRAVLSSSAA